MSLNECLFKIFREFFPINLRPRRLNDFTWLLSTIRLAFLTAFSGVLPFISASITFHQSLTRQHIFSLNWIHTRLECNANIDNNVIEIRRPWLFSCSASTCLVSPAPVHLTVYPRPTGRTESCMKINQTCHPLTLVEFYRKTTKQLYRYCPFEKHQQRNSANLHQHFCWQDNTCLLFAIHLSFFCTFPSIPVILRYSKCVSVIKFPEFKLSLTISTR